MMHPYVDVKPIEVTHNVKMDEVNDDVKPYHFIERMEEFTKLSDKER